MDPQPSPPLDDDRALSRLRALLRISTVSRPSAADGANADGDGSHHGASDAFLETLRDLYPRVGAALDVELVADHTLLLRWEGAARLAPVVLMAHYDVVPADGEGWRHPPFDAVVTGDRRGGRDERVVWGRGTLDDKGALVALLEAVDALLASGWSPPRDVYLSFGHDEETDGSGASAVVDLLESRGVEPALVLDEGGAVVSGVFPGVRRPMAVIGVSEKGSTRIALTVEQKGGHASTPPRLAAPVRLARALVRLDRSPFPSRLGAVDLEMIGTLGAGMRGPLGPLFRRADRMAPLLVALFTRLSDETRAILRTTQAVTMLSGSAAPNVLADRAEAVVDLRIAVGSSVEESVAHLRNAIRDRRVRIEVRHPGEPSPVSPREGYAWTALTTALAETYPAAIPTPYVMLAASDSRHFTRISGYVYRFSPFEMSSEERASIHGVDERIRVSTFLRGIDFYRRLITDL